jgi:hypothetical protein
MFRKSLGNKASKMFRKGIATSANVSKGLGGASGALSGAIKKAERSANELGRVPFVKQAISLSPEAQDALATARTGVKVGKDVAVLLKGGSELFDPLSYKKIMTKTGGINAGAVQKNVQSGLQRAKDLGEDVEALYRFVK